MSDSLTEIYKEMADRKPLSKKQKEEIRKEQEARIKAGDQIIDTNKAFIYAILKFNNYPLDMRTMVNLFDEYVRQALREMEREGIVECKDFKYKIKDMK